jgi:sporulation protein YlmC with PRC-barrel domain
VADVVAAKRRWAGLHLLDRQIVDRDGRMAGNVDDVELDDDGTSVHVTALLAGGDVLARRLRWGTRARDDEARIPLARVADLGDHVTVSLGREELGTFRGERWVRDHIIARIPGSRSAPPE